MKKNYHAPAVEIVESTACVMIAASLDITDLPAQGDYEEGGDTKGERVGMDVLWEPVFRK